VTTHSANSRQPPGAAGPTILLVDDHEELRWVLARILTREGYEVLLAENGRAALAVIEELQRPVDLIISDVRMPAMGGEELIAALSDRHVSRHLLFMTGEGTRYGPTLAGVTVLQKPFSREALLERVHELLSLPPARERGRA
jgi:two-component system cell cycle sensor histidine kinase/response regulator CckA